MSDGVRYLEHLEGPELEQTLQAWKARSPTGGALVLLPEHEKARVAAVQAASRASGVPVVGAIFPTLIRDGSFVERGAWLFFVPEALRYALVENVNGSAGAAGKISAAVLPLLDGQQRTLFLVFDATLPNVATLVEGLYVELADKVRYLGVNAGSETFQPMPCLFDAERVVGNGALCVLLPPDARSALMHDYTAPEEPSIATSTSENRISSIDWRPAFEFYREKVKAQFGVALDAENFYRYAVQYPLGILQANGQIVVRMPTSLEPDGSIRCLGEVPPNSLLAVVQAPPPGSPAAAAQLSAVLRERHFPEDTLFFYCAGRRMRLGQASPEDLRTLVASSQRRLAGATCLGEVGITSNRAFPNFHNGSFVATGW